MLKDAPDNENELLLRLRKGDESAFSSLYAHYSPRIYYAALRMVKDEQVAEDLVQKVFTRIWKNREKIRIGESFSGYLFRAARNLTYDHFRKLRRDRELYQRFADLSTSQYTHVEEILLGRERSALLETVMALLPPQRRKVFYLCRIEGHSYKQVGEQLNITTSTVKDHLIKASRSIRAFLNHYNVVIFPLLLVLRIFF